MTDWIRGGIITDPSRVAQESPMTYAVYLACWYGGWRPLRGGSGLPSLDAAKAWLAGHGGVTLPLTPMPPMQSWPCWPFMRGGQLWYITAEDGT